MGVPRRERRKQSSKGRCQLSHFERRCDERIGYTLTSEKKKEILSLIRSGRSLDVIRQTNRVSVHKVEGFEDFWFVYDKNSKNLVTVLKDEYDIN